MASITLTTNDNDVVRALVEITNVYGGTPEENIKAYFAEKMINEANAFLQQEAYNAVQFTPKDPNVIT